MANVLIESTTLDSLAEMIAAKSGEALPLSLDEMIDAVHGIPEGGGTPTLQDKTVNITPSASAQTQTVTADQGYDGLGEVEVNTAAVPKADLYSLIPARVLSDSWYIDSDGVVSAQIELSSQEHFVVQDGYVTEEDTLLVYNQQSVDYQLPTQPATTITPTTSEQTAVAARKWTTGAVTVEAMPSGSATPAASISGTSATVSTGTNTLTLSKTVSNTPQVSAGYVSSGTAGNSNVSLTASVTTKAAATITPGTTNQTIASGTYLTGTQTISGDANLVAGNIKSGTSIFGVAGTYSGGGTLTVATKTATLSAVGQTLSFTNLSGTPKYWFVKTTSQISSSGSTTIYYITDGFWDGTSVKGNSFRIGSTRRIYSWTSGVTQSYSGGTLTITGGSATGSSPGRFFNGDYELTYVY